ncbi:MAG: hypothetical protein Q9169_008567, partial [Polycauliona sp. 2 TL-2023]
MTTQKQYIPTSSNWQKPSKLDPWMLFGSQWQSFPKKDLPSELQRPASDHRPSMHSKPGYQGLYYLGRGPEETRSNLQIRLHFSDKSSPYTSDGAAKDM